MELIEDAEKRKGEPLTTLEKIQAGWTPYIPTAVSGAATISSIVGAAVVGQNHEAALAAIIAAKDLALQRHQAKVDELYGKGSSDKVQREVEHDQLCAAVQNIDLTAIIETGNGDELFMDSLTGRLFKSSKTALERGMNKFNYRLNQGHEMYGSLNEFFQLRDVNLPNVMVGDYLGFNVDHPLELSFRYDGPNKVYRIMYYIEPPSENFTKIL